MGQWVRRPEDLPVLAMGFAIAAHGGQRYGALPYSAHLRDVAAILATSDPVMVAAAWLHDVLEDTRVTYQELLMLFGVEVAELVRAVTNEPPEPDGGSKLLTYRKTRAFGSRAILLKLADRVANVQRSSENAPEKLEKYRRDYGLFRSCLNTDGLLELDGDQDPRTFAALWNHLHTHLGGEP